MGIKAFIFTTSLLLAGASSVHAADNSASKNRQPDTALKAKQEPKQVKSGGTQPEAGVSTAPAPLGYRLEQQAVYRKITELLNLAQSDTSLLLAQGLLPMLQNYPLYPYAQYQVLKAKGANRSLQLAEIQGFAAENPNLPDFFAADLKSRWVSQLQQQQAWQTLWDNRAAIADNAANRCLLIQAEQKTLPKPTALLNESQQNTLSALWQSGQTLPETCLPLIAQWQQQGGIDTAQLAVRAMKLFADGNSTQLNGLGAHGDFPGLDRLQSLLKNPAVLPTFIEGAEVNEQNKAVLSAAFPRFVRTLKEADFKGQTDPFAPYQVWAIRFGLDEKAQQQWRSALLWQLFDSEDAELQQWRDAQILSLKEDRQTERRLRTAIRQKTDLSPWLAVLSAETVAKEEWQYWQAKNWQARKQTKKADAILQRLSRTRGFYGMLAAADLNRAYQPEMQTLPQTEPPLEQQFSQALARIDELRQINGEGDVNSNREWRSLMKQADFAQKLALSHYAAERHWYDLAVDATIEAKAWGYIALRLPNAYPDWFELNLKDKAIRRSFAMAIARQESAWKATASSSANAMGLMQLLPTTAKATAEKFKLPYNNQRQLFEPFNNIMLGTAHLQELYDRFGDNRILIAAAYNAGSSRVEQWLKRAGGSLSMAEFVASIPFYETRGYVQNVLTYDYYYQLLQGASPIKFSKAEYDRVY